MSEWQRLTQDDQPGNSDIIMRYRYNGNDDAYPHEIAPEDDSEGVCLAPAELQALVTITGVWREVPEVRAMVEASRSVYKTQWPHTIYDIVTKKDFDLAEQFAIYMHDLHAALAAIEGADDTPLVQNH